MSADNGIYILVTQALFGGKPAGQEYRVAHAMAIDNLYYDVETGEPREDFIPEVAFQYFGDCVAHRNDVTALDVADLLAREYPILEYGVSFLWHQDQVFQTFTVAELEAYNAKVDAIIERHRREQEAERKAKIDAAKFVVGGGETFEPTAVYGYIRIGGKKIHGALHGVKEVRINRIEGEAYFLPSDWSK
jgi:hypothetical protein